MSSVDSGPLRDGRVGPYTPTMGVPTADAIWSGPVSPEIISDAPRARATRSATVVWGAIVAAPAAAPTVSSASARSPGPHSTTDSSPVRSRRSRASDAYRDGGQI